MPIEQAILHTLDTAVSPKRKKHILGVAQTAKQLAKRYGADPQKAYLAGLLHDFKVDDFKPGTGLGLYICRIIIQRLGGQIRIDTGYTSGCKMVVTLPV